MLSPFARGSSRGRFYMTNWVGKITERGGQEPAVAMAKKSLADNSLRLHESFDLFAV
jgi:hypothetical protein